jgi:hypothetical protein
MPIKVIFDKFSSLIITPEIMIAMSNNESQMILNDNAHPLSDVRLISDDKLRSCRKGPITIIFRLATQLASQSF